MKTPPSLIRLIARGWDEQKQEWVFREFLSPEFRIVSRPCNPLLYVGIFIFGTDIRC
jgi:hypothetical protein